MDAINRKYKEIGVSMIAFSRKSIYIFRSIGKLRTRTNHILKNLTTITKFFSAECLNRNALEKFIEAISLIFTHKMLINVSINFIYSFSSFFD